MKLIPLLLLICVLVGCHRKEKIVGISQIYGNKEYFFRVHSGDTIFANYDTLIIDIWDEGDTAASVSGHHWDLMPSHISAKETDSTYEIHIINIIKGDFINGDKIINK